MNRRPPGDKVPRNDTRIATPASPPFRNPAAISPEIQGQEAPDRAICVKVRAMKESIIRVVTNEKLTRITHWTVFSVGALTLAFSIAATAARAF